MYRSFLSIEWRVLMLQPFPARFAYFLLSYGARMPSRFSVEAMEASDAPSAYISKMRRTTCASAAFTSRVKGMAAFGGALRAPLTRLASFGDLASMRPDEVSSERSPSRT